ncbi:MAG: hypothetical protein BJ554DRAFT_1848 [Olpidium bornovanus]|uniref:Uncharacterized protein n=1 Tax=Olpidium bornovanus TaxID=278681 RepID=A0A8H8DHD1_9FUNG|nr:MAG: hypothetical protein BJ554DRAFT_1848 [Olpidium bornovanus]
MTAEPRPGGGFFFFAFSDICDRGKPNVVTHHLAESTGRHLARDRGQDILISRLNRDSLETGYWQKSSPPVSVDSARNPRVGLGN